MQYLIITKIVKPGDCNQYHNLFGGVLLASIDEAAAIFAKIKTGEEICVTKKFGEVLFNKPVPLGSIIYVYCEIVKQGTTSITIKATVKYTKDFEEQIDVASCELVFVALDSEGKPKSITWK